MTLKPRLPRAPLLRLLAAGDRGGRERLRGGHSRQGHARCKRAGADGEPVAPPRGTDPDTRARRMEMEDRKSKIDTFLAVTGMSVTGLWLALGFKF